MKGSSIGSKSYASEELGEESERGVIARPRGLPLRVGSGLPSLRLARGTFHNALWQCGHFTGFALRGSHSKSQREHFARVTTRWMDDPAASGWPTSGASSRWLRVVMFDIVLLQIITRTGMF